MAGGNPRLGRQAEDFYSSPPDITRALMAAWRPTTNTVEEPACGNGAMAIELEAAGLNVIASDLYDYGYGQTGIDFLQATERRANCMITNPPFKLAEAFIRKAIALGYPEFALVLKSTYWHAKSRTALWNLRPPSAIMPLLWRPDFLNRGAPTMEICWTIFSAPTSDPIYRRLPRPISDGKTTKAVSKQTLEAA